ncbi:colorectal cancer associated 2 [Genypterus blacodes]|uniref:colorectal cancer associated 2 n=1 Tax=Genypterus blacodes TaxID=154954 RepID=UPI003F761B19
MSDGLQLPSGSFSGPDGSCCIQTHDASFHDCQQQFADVMLPGNSYSGGGGGGRYGGSGTGGAQAAYPSFPLPWTHGLSSDADYYGPGTAPSSSPDSIRLCSPNSYSPQDSFSSSSSSSCYDSPSRMESSFQSFTPEHYHYQHCTLQDCYCLPPHCWPGQQESLCGPEYSASAYCGPSDYSYAYPVEENCYKRDLPLNPEMCYNVL